MSNSDKERWFSVRDKVSDMLGDAIIAFIRMTNKGEDVTGLISLMFDMVNVMKIIGERITDEGELDE